MCRAALLPFLVFALPLAAATNALDAARQALRDGLWEVARAQAARSGAPEARLIVLESYAREARWADLLGALDGWNGPESEGVRIYRALAACRTGDAAAAAEQLSAPFTEPRYVRAAARLAAEMALAAGDAAAAVDVLKRDGGDDDESRLLLADACDARGARGDAERIWRAVAGRTNAAEQVRLAAAERLGEAAVLRAVRAQLTLPALRRRAGLRLGLALLEDETQFAEGEKLVCALVHDAPDAEGARAAFLALAQKLIDRRDWAAAARAFTRAAETWPDVGRSAPCQMNIGWAQAGLGRFEAALAAFTRAADLSVEAETKALALVKAGDMLSALGRDAEATARYRAVRAAYPSTPAGKKIAGVLRLREEEAKARALYADYRFADAQQLFETLAREDPARRARFLFCSALCLYGQGLDDEAERRARALAEGNAEAAVRAEATRWLAKYAYNRGRWKMSADLFLAYADGNRANADAAAECLVWAARAALAGNDYPRALSTASLLVSRYPRSPRLAAGLIAQGEALIELARFDEALLVFERASAAAGASDDDRLRAQLLRADALFAMGADSPVRYRAALEAYQAALLAGNPTPTQKLTLSFKIARTLEKLKRHEEAIDQYYTQVVLAYRAGCEKGETYDDAARAVFSSAAFRLADEYESRGRDFQAIRILELVVASRVPAADEAVRRLARLSRKGDAP